MATTQRKKPRKKPRDGDSPVTVGGGAGLRPKLLSYVEMEFDHDVHYFSDSDYPDDWVSEIRQLDYVEIQDAARHTIDTYPVVSKVDVAYLVKAKTEHIVFKNYSGDPPLKIKFKGLKGKDLPFRGGKHRGDGLELQSVRIDNDTIDLDPTWKVKVHTKFITRRSTKQRAR